jgi:putative nucleotidyltransferase with HDIG domain
MHERIGDRKGLLEYLLQNVVVQFLLFAAFVAALVAVVTAGFEARGTAPDRSLVDKPAPRDIRATHHFSIPETNFEASEQRKERAARAVPPVFDWNIGLGEAYRQRISTAFEAMQQALAERARSHLDDHQPGTLDSIRATDSEEMRRRLLIEALSPERRLTLARSLRDAHFSSHLNAELPDTDFDTLARHGFPESAEQVLAHMLGRVMDKAIVDPDALPETDSKRGIYLRRLRDDKLLIEYHLTNPEERLVPLRDVPGLVREIAPQVSSSIRDDALRSATISAAISLVRPNTTFNKRLTRDKKEAAKRAVADNTQHYEFSKNEIIVERGHIVTNRHYRIIKKMYEEDQHLNRVQIVAGTVFFALLLVVILYTFGHKYLRRFQPSRTDIFFSATVLILFLLVTQVGKGLSHANVQNPTMWYYGIPVAAGGMLVRLVLNNEFAIVFTIVFSLLAGLVVDSSLYFTAFTALGTLVGIATVQQVTKRVALMWSGVTVGAVNIASVLAFMFMQGELFYAPGSALRTALIGFGGGVASGLFVLATLPVFEALFGYTTDIKLLELANLDHPLLRQLIVRAPGSYHHSMMVSSLCEAAAEAIDCNPLLARVGAYYHDIGKAQNPQYFAENQKPDENLHEELKPNMSALIIKNHVKDGLEMAREHGLPEEIRDFIAQHHGTSLISYFYHQAKQMEDPDIPEVKEEDYRYPGPKPQTRETAICMLADGIEAASRAMANPSPARLKGLVQKMINRAFTDGQLDECDLTLRDLDQIAQAMTRILTGIFHHRPEYPDQDNDRDERMSRTTSASSPDDEADHDEEASLEAASSGGQTAADREDGANDRRGQSQSERGDDTPSTETADQEQDDARTDSDTGSSDESSGDGSTVGDDSDEGRESLPRLGS